MKFYFHRRVSLKFFSILTDVYQPIMDVTENLKTLRCVSAQQEDTLQRGRVGKTLQVCHCQVPLKSVK